MAKKRDSYLGIQEVLIENLDDETKHWLEKEIIQKLYLIESTKSDLKNLKGSFDDRIKGLKKHVNDMLEALKNKDVSSLDYSYGKDWKQEISCK